MDYELEGKTVVVTGAAQGIGAEITTSLLNQGAYVIAIDLNVKLILLVRMSIVDRTAVKRRYPERKPAMFAGFIRACQAEMFIKVLSRFSPVF